MATAKAKVAEESRGPEVQEDKYYDVSVTETVEFQKVRFGIVSQTQVSGDFLKELLAAPEGSKISAYVEHV